MVYPAIDAGVAVTGSTGVVRNPLQFDNGSISGFSVGYGPDRPILTPLSLSSTHPQQNALIYSMYKKFCGADRANLVSLPIRFQELPWYHIYAIPIYNQASGIHVNADPRNIDFSLATTTFVARQAIVVIVRFAGGQIDYTGYFNKMT